MRYFERKEDVVREYSVDSDRRGLIVLLDQLVRKCSYRIDGFFDVTKYVKAGYQDISDAKLPNGDPEFENIDCIYRYTSCKPFSFHDDSVGLEGTRVVAPKLANIIDKLLNGNPSGIRELLKYSESEELIPIDDRIIEAGKKIDSLDNALFVGKKIALEELRNLYTAKETGQFFDTDMLKQFYDRTCTLVTLQLISERRLKPGNKVLLKDYISAENNKH